MIRRLIVRAEAEAEMADAFDWYENRAAGLGYDFLLCVDAILNAISRNPESFPRVHRIVRRALTRRFPYEVFFVEDDERIVEGASGFSVGFFIGSYAHTRSDGPVKSCD